MNKKITNQFFSFSATLLLSTSTLFAQVGSWTQKTDFGDTRTAAVSFSIGAKGYIGTGNEGGIVALTDFWEYDPSSDVWTQKADFGGAARESAVGFCIGSKGYIGTGFDGNGNAFKDFWEYDPETNTWTEKTDFAGTARYIAVGFSINNIGYIGTGSDTSGNELKDFWAYDPESDIWTQKADFGGTKRYYALGFSIGNNGFLGTGFNNQIPLNDFWEYDPKIDTWTQQADFGGTARGGAAGFSLGSKGYVGTGTIVSGDISVGNNDSRNDFWEYDPKINTWTQKADFGGIVRYDAIGFSIGNNGYIGIGTDENTNPSTDFWQYTTPDTLVTTNTSEFVPINLVTITVYDQGRRMVTITPTAGLNALNGNVTVKASFDGNVKTYNAKPYVPRHYDIIPDNSPSTAQATIVLYFLQSEFDAYNTYVTSNSLGLPLLPTGGIDNGNLVVTQFHGTGTAIGNYTGLTVLIIPTVTWNAANGWWEVAFPVTGFSGFYITTGNAVLPISLLSFTGILQNNSALLNWQTSLQHSISQFDIERSADEIHFLQIGKVNASGNINIINNYRFNDLQVNKGLNFYRLKIINTDGNYIYSKSVAIRSSKKTELQIFPNPAKNILYIQANRENEKALLQIVDVSGKAIREESIILNGNTSFTVDIENLPKGTYNLLLKSKSLNEQKKFVKE